MKTTTIFLYRIKGFTLVEMAVVLVILALLLGGLLMPLSAQIHQRNYAETRQTLENVKNALVGYAIANNGVLPHCSNDNDGSADATCTDEGYVPWLDLGLGMANAKDGWDNPLRYRVDSKFSAAYTLSTATTADGLKVQDTQATPTVLTQANPNAPVALLFSCGKNGLPDVENDADGAVNTNATCINPGIPNKVYTSDTYREGVFDDVMIWLPRYLLLNRLVSASVLVP